MFDGSPLLIHLKVFVQRLPPFSVLRERGFILVMLGTGPGRRPRRRGASETLRAWTVCSDKMPLGWRAQGRWRVTCRGPGAARPSRGTGRCEALWPHRRGLAVRVNLALLLSEAFVERGDRHTLALGPYPRRLC